MLRSNFTKSIIIGSAMMLMVGCGSGSVGTQPVGFSGKFVDGPVDGVTWQCGTSSGVTKDGGLFGACPIGSTVNFSIGNLQIGSAVEAEGGDDRIFTIREVASDPVVAKIIAQIILTVTNPTASATETLTISAADIVAVNNLNLTTIDVDTTLPATIGGTTTVEATVAETHLDSVVTAISSGAIAIPALVTTAPVVSAATD